MYGNIKSVVEMHRVAQMLKGIWEGRIVGNGQEIEATIYMYNIYIHFYSCTCVCTCVYIYMYI